MRTRALLVALVALTAGCLGGTDEPTASTDEATEAAETPSDPVRTWTTVERSGTVTGAGLAGTGASQADGNSATWQVPADATVLYLNVSAEQAADGTGSIGQLSLEYGPNCQTQDTVSCDYNTTTEAGEAREVVEAPAGGTWDVYLFPENNAGDTDWTVTVAMDSVQR